jgi:hypothetical protein
MNCPSLELDDEAGAETDSDSDTEEDLYDEELERFLESEEEEVECEDTPDYYYEAGETRSEDANYTICPAVHRKQALRIFTKHLCQHMLFPERREGRWDAATIRYNAVLELYSYCKQRGLPDLWAYMWNSWYSPKMWVLWARSADNRLSRQIYYNPVMIPWAQLPHPLNLCLTAMKLKTK